MKRLHVYLTKEEIDPDRLAGHTAVVIDVVLATTTMITLMERGAKRVFPVGSIEEMQQLAQQLDRTKMITGGEEKGYKIDGFDYGPLPEEYSEQVVGDKDVIFLSSNGTRAIRRAETASRLLLASLRNAPSTAAYLQQAVSSSEKLFIICSGSGGQMCLEDFYCAGMLLSQLDLAGVPYNDSAQLALDFFAANCSSSVIDVLLRSRVGRHFAETDQMDLLHFAGDVGAASAIVGMDGRHLVRLH